MFTRQSKKLPDSISIVWTIQDVLGTAKEMEIEISEDEAREILQNVKRHLDSEYGVNWDTIRSEIDDYIDEQEQEDE